MINLDRPRRILAAALAGLAGYVDAVGFLSADRYFVSFMSGNTTRLATDFVVERDRAFIPALLIGGFVLGVAAGSVAAHLGGRWRKPAVLAFVTVLLGAGCGFALAGHVAPMMGCLVLAMGALNATMQAGEVPVALTYLTGALVRMGQGLAGLVTGRRVEGLPGYLALWMALALGAALGATVFLAFGPPSLWGAFAASVLLTLAGWRIARISARS